MLLFFFLGLERKGTGMCFRLDAIGRFWDTSEMWLFKRHQVVPPLTSQRSASLRHLIVDVQYIYRVPTAWNFVFASFWLGQCGGCLPN